MRCYAQLGATGQPDALELLFNDSGMGVIGVGVNTILVELENRRAPRPLAVLAPAVVTIEGANAAAAAPRGPRFRCLAHHSFLICRQKQNERSP